MGEGIEVVEGFEVGGGIDVVKEIDLVKGRLFNDAVEVESDEGGTRLGDGILRKLADLIESKKSQHTVMEKKKGLARQQVVVRAMDPMMEMQRKMLTPRRVRPKL